MKHIMFGDEEAGRYRPLSHLEMYQQHAASLKRKSDGTVDTKQNTVKVVTTMDVIETTNQYVIGQLTGTNDVVYVQQDCVGVLESHNMGDIFGRYAVVITNVVKTSVADAQGDEVEDGFVLIGSVQAANEIIGHDINRQLLNHNHVYVDGRVMRVTERLTRNKPVARVLLQVTTDTGLPIKFTVNMADVSPTHGTEANTGFIKQGTRLNLEIVSVDFKPFVPHDSRDKTRAGLVMMYHVRNSANEELEETLLDLANGHRHSMFYVAVVDNKHQNPLIEVAPHVYFQGVLNDNNPKTNQVKLLPADGTQHTPVWGEILSVRRAKGKNGELVLQGHVRIDDYPYGTVRDNLQMPF